MTGKPGRPVLTLTDGTVWQRGPDHIFYRREGSRWLTAYRVRAGDWRVRVAPFVATGTARAPEWHPAGARFDLPGTYEGSVTAMAAADEWLGCNT